MVREVSRPVDLRKVKVTDEFWKNEMELVRKEVIPYQWEAINDRVEGAEPSFAMRNYKLAGEITAKKKALGDKFEGKTWPLVFALKPESMDKMEDRFYGFLFQDSDFSKWIEAVAYSLAQHPDAELEKVADRAIDIVCAAQQENGYLDTYYIINDISKAFTNLKDNHELYCFGHLTEGAVAYYQATGKSTLLETVKRYADYICSRFGRGEGQIKGYPGHEIAEMALVRLYEVTGERKYLELSKYFIDERGQKPYFFDQEHPEEVKRHGDNEWYHYYQAHKPVREQDEAVGHAVRAVYLYSGMADIARLTQDESLFKACENLWNNIEQKKLYITGGIGGTHIGEAFSFNYDLPNDTAYSETCAAIGLVFFARRMLEMDIDSKYANVMERALYNTVLSGMALDGKSFFYVNPLEVLPKACHQDERKHHVKPVRQKWFGCACCPPNIARTVSSVASYAYTENEDTLFMHLYVGGTVEKEYRNASITWEVESRLPWEGKLSIRCKEVRRTEYDGDKVATSKSDLENMSVKSESGVGAQTIAVRIPDWCDSYKIDCGKHSCKVEKGYAYVTGEFKEGDCIRVDLEMSVRIMQANTAVVEDQGKLAVSYGPIVYCIEEADNGADLHLVSLIPDASAARLAPIELAGTRVLGISLPGRRLAPSLPAAGASLGAAPAALYTPYAPASATDITLHFIPYYTWANRGEGEMEVWVRM